MGTIAWTVVMQNKMPMIAHENHSDGYPEGLGISILKQLRRWEWNLIREKLKVYQIVPKEEFDKYRNGRWLDEEAFAAAHPHFCWGSGDQLLESILDASPTGLVESGYNFSFGYDSLMCEWAYVIDLDYDMLFVYRGMNTVPLSPSELFYVDPLPKNCADGYYPVRLCAMYSLEKLPDDELFSKGIKNSVKRQDAIANGDYSLLSKEQEAHGG